MVELISVVEYNKLAKYILWHTIWHIEWHRRSFDPGGAGMMDDFES